MPIAAEVAPDEPQHAAEPDPRPVLFLHIPKTAGTSLLTTLQNLFGENRTWRFQLEDPALLSKLDALMRDGAERPACLNGHLPVHLFADNLEKFRPFTMLRHPVARVFSLYRFNRARPNIEQMGLRRGFTFEEFLTSRAPEIFGQVNNGMCRSLCGDWDASDPAANAYWNIAKQPRMVEGALRTLSMMDFGLVEDMQQSHRIMQEAWGVPFALDEVTVNTTEPDDTEDDWRNVLRVVECNTLDITLYERAAAMFRARMGTPLAACRHKSGDMIFGPRMNASVEVPDIPGRQGFHAWEDVGFSWLIQGPPARIHFRAPARIARILLRVYSLTADYPLHAVKIELNGSAVEAMLRDRDEHWCTIEIQPVVMEPGVNRLTIAPPYFVPVAFLEPNANDDRYLSIALSSIAFEEP